MEISKEDLIQRYSERDDDSLIRTYLQGTLTPIATDAIKSELDSRKIPLDKDGMREILLEPPRQVIINKEPSKKKKEWKDSYFNLLCVFAIILVLLLGFLLLIFNPSNRYDTAFSIACLIALYIAPFGIIFGFFGLRFNKKHNIDNDLIASAIFINVLFLLLGLYNNPFSQMARAFGT